MVTKLLFELPCFLEYENKIFHLRLISDEKDLRLGYFTEDDFYNKIFKVKCKYFICIEGIENDQDLKNAVKDIQNFLSEHNILKFYPRKTKTFTLK